MADSKLKSLTIIPMGSPPKEEAPAEEKSEEKEEDGLRESFDEFVAAMAADDSDGAFEALRNFVDMCAMKSAGGEY